MFIIEAKGKQYRRPSNRGTNMATYTDRHTRFNDGLMSHWEREVYTWQYGSRGSHFDMQMVIVYSKADTSNRKRIAESFPELADAFNNWFNSMGVFDDQQNVHWEAWGMAEATADALQDVRPETGEIEGMQAVLDKREVTND
jgi:hypothetical protein